MREARDLGPSAPGRVVAFTLVLRLRDQNGLLATLSDGVRVTPATWGSTYGPAASTIAHIRLTLARAGLTTEWMPGDELVKVRGPTAAAERLLHVRIDSYVLGATTRFYASTRPPAVPSALSPWVSAVVGPSDYSSDIAAAIPHLEAGLSPAEATEFYDMTPLRQAGLDGTGMTVMFIETTMPGAASLAAYAKQFGLPPFDVTVRTDVGAWGAPVPTSESDWSDLAGETALDLEVVHGLAPGAREIVYEEGDDTAVPAMMQTMIKENPGAILSSSYSMANCEIDPGSHAAALALNPVAAHGSAEGTTIYFASGDQGAYGCIQDEIPSTENALSVDPDVDSPFMTGVGGTSAFAASNGAYYKEAAWGEPLETWGSGGGFSTIFKQPAYQVAPGLAANSLSGRGVPDVSCDADNDVSGWAVFTPGSKESQVEEYASGGTSAAAPCWAAITALIDEDLKQQGLPEVGFVNPALYYFSRSPAGLPAVAFHQVTGGSNLHYEATAGWNAATGLGTPDVAHLADDFEWYERQPHHT
jgi:kumamolisin